jgi:type I restriction enzyme S subunit
MTFKYVDTVYGRLPADLNCAKLVDLCAASGVQTGPFGSQLHQEDYVVNGTPIITVEHLGDNRIVHENLPRVSDEDKARLCRYHLKTGDIVFSRVGSVDRRALVQAAEDGWLFSGRCLRVRPNPEVLNAGWLSYYFGLPAFKNYIRGIAVGATMPSINTKILSDVPIYFPDIVIQRKAAKFLSLLDSRITLLREINLTLEAIAQAIFKSWFVDFDPVRAKAEGRQPDGLDEATTALFPDSFEHCELGEIPNGWSIKKMEDISTVGIGKTPPRKEAHWFSKESKNIRWVSIRDMGDFGVYALQTSEFLTKEAVEKFNVRIVPDNTVIMSFKMTIGRVALTNGEMATNEAIAHFKLVDTPEITSEFIYLHLKQFNYSGLSSTSSIADAVNSKTVRDIPILKPSARVLFAFQDAITPIFDMLKKNELQAQILSSLRDTMLPRLISGQLRLPDAEEQIKAATA